MRGGPPSPRRWTSRSSSRRMYFPHAPELRDTEVHCAMPAPLRRTGVRSAWADANRGGRAVDSFLEGPVADGNGNLYVTDIPFGRIFRITPSLVWEVVAEYGGEPNGMKLLDDNHLVVTD